MPQKIELDPDKLRELYHVQGMTLAEVGAELGVSAATVRSRMAEHGIERRGGRGADLDADDLRRLYVDDGLSVRETASELGVSPATVLHAMRAYGIEARDHWQEPPEPLGDAAALDRLYHDEGMTLAEIGELAGVSHTAVLNHMRRHGIETRGAARPAELLDDVVRVAEELGRPPTMPEYDERGEWSPHTVGQRLGTWLRAKECARMTLEAEQS